MTSIGNIEIQDLFVGSANAVGLYQGAVEVWSKDTPQPTSPNTKVKYTAASGLPDWEGNIEGDISKNSIPNIESIEEVNIGTSVTTIANQTFMLRATLKKVIIPNTVTSIGDWGFGAANISDITIPSSVTSMGNNVFTGCQILTNVTMDGKTMAQVQGMTNYPWGLASGTTIHCTDGDITIS